MRMIGLQGKLQNQNCPGSNDSATKTMMGDTKIVAVTRDPERLTSRLGENLIPTLSIVKVRHPCALGVGPNAIVHMLVKAQDAHRLGCRVM